MVAVDSGRVVHRNGVLDFGAGQIREAGFLAARFGVFLTTLIAFFLVEIGDKTQVATAALAAKYQTLLPVIAGTTLGMMLADVPAVWLGKVAATNLPLKLVRSVAAAIFLLLGVIALFAVQFLMGV